MDRIKSKMKKLKEILREMESAVVAYSGGVDSTFLLKVARDELGKKIVCATALSEVYIGDNDREVKKLLKELEVRQVKFQIKFLGMKDFFTNPPDRCYFCKKKIFSELKKIAKQERMDYIIDGTNYDDLSEFRPGRKAIEELGIRTPLAEAGLDKKDIRLLSYQLGLFTWDQPSSTCLATRIPCGEEIDLRKLRMIKEGESFIKELGIRDLRLRHHRGDIAKIELAESEARRLISPAIREKIITGLKTIGYIQVIFVLKNNFALVRTDAGGGLDK
jgi:uncharacterized protein